LKKKDLRETVASLKRGKVGLDACPRCGSINVSVITVTGYITQNIYVCNDCGFQNSLFLELFKDEGEGKPEAEKRVIKSEEAKEKQ
jgi:transcription elongation factor Elf1